MIYSHREAADAWDETARQIEETDKLLAALDDKFGSFIDSIDIPSMEEVFCDDFGLDVVQPRARSSRNGQTMQIDVLAYDYPGGGKDVYIVNATRRVDENNIEWIKGLIEDFPKYFPWGRDRTVYGLIAGIDIPDNVRKKGFERRIVSGAHQPRNLYDAGTARIQTESFLSERQGWR